MNALLSLICSFWMTALLGLAPVSALGIAGLHYDSLGHVGPTVAYDENRSPASDYDSGPVLPAQESENRIQDTSAVFAKFAGFLAAEGIGEGPGAMTRLRYEANPKHASFQRGTASPAPQAGQGALDGSVGFSPNSAGRVGLDADGVPVVFRQHTDGVFHGYRVPFEDLTAAQKNALIENGFVNRKGVPLP